MSNITLTTTSGGLHMGDIISMPTRVTLRRRFLMWLLRPWRWPPKTVIGTYVVTRAATGHSV